MAAELLDVSQISERLGVPKHRIRYLIMARRIDEARRVGTCRLFEAKVVDRLREEINGKAIAHVS